MLRCFHGGARVTDPTKLAIWSAGIVRPAEWQFEQGTALLDPFCCVVCVLSGPSARRLKVKPSRIYLQRPLYVKRNLTGTGLLPDLANKCGSVCTSVF